MTPLHSAGSARPTARSQTPPPATGDGLMYYRFQKIAPRVKNSRKISKNLATFAKKNRKMQNFPKFRELTTVQRNALCSSRRELSNEYFIAKFGFDTAENEPREVCWTVRLAPEQASACSRQRFVSALTRSSSRRSALAGLPFIQ